MKRSTLLVYDIADDQRRAAIRRILNESADRIQQSAWLVPAEAPIRPRRLVNTLAQQAEPGDRIRAYAPCAACARTALWLPRGYPVRLRVDTGWIS